MNAKIIAADEWYTTPITVSGPSYETGVLAKTGRRRLWSFYAFNSSNSVASYIALMDSLTSDLTKCFAILPLGALSWYSWTFDGDRLANGLYINAFTDIALQVPAAPVMFYRAGFRATF